MESAGWRVRWPRSCGGRAVGHVIVSAFDRRVLAAMKRADARVRPGLLYDRAWRRFREDVRRLGVESVHPRLSAIDAEALRWVRSVGVRVFPWVAKDRGDVDRCRAADFIDGVMVNDLALFGDAGSRGRNPDRTCKTTGVEQRQKIGGGTGMYWDKEIETMDRTALEDAGRTVGLKLDRVARYYAERQGGWWMRASGGC